MRSVCCEIISSGVVSRFRQQLTAEGLQRLKLFSWTPALFWKKCNLCWLVMAVCQCVIDSVINWCALALQLWPLPAIYLGMWYLAWEARKNSGIYCTVSLSLQRRDYTSQTNFQAVKFLVISSVKFVEHFDTAWCYTLHERWLFTSVCWRCTVCRWWPCCGGFQYCLQW